MASSRILPSYDENRQMLGEIYPLSTPFNVIIDASEACNLKCGYCFRGQKNSDNQGYADGGLMEWDTFCLTVEQIKEFPETVKQISLSNHGEPLCNRKLPDMVRHIKENGIKSRISIHTNAVLLDYEYALDLANSGIDRVVVSVQGLSDAKYEEVCGVKLDFMKFYERIKCFSEHKKNTGIHIKIIDVALEQGEDRRFYELFEPIADRVYIEKMVPIWKNTDSMGITKEGRNKFGDSFPRQECCPLIFHTIVVTPIGDVYPCTQLLSPFTLGNIRERSIRECWESSERRELLIRQCELNNPDICDNCFILQNSIYTKEDMIDEYRMEILGRLQSEG